MRQPPVSSRFAPFVLLALAAFPGAGTPHVDARQPSALHIVVIEGEDAVNIIQQKTAVAPVIEVRDRNDQPVAGAIVNFAIRSGRATFGGARTLSVTTNAAGRAIAAGFAPSGTGALQISATAAFQGQTAAAITIAQTTVQTVAEAAAVSSAGAGAGGSGGSASAGAGAGAGGGGGLSGTTIGIVGAAAAAGTVVAVKELGGAGKAYTGQFGGTLLTGALTGASCAQNEQQTGTMEVRVEDDNGTISGTTYIEGKIALSPGTCPPNSYNTSTDSFYLKRRQVSGSSSSLAFSFNESNTYPPTNGGTGGVNSYDFSFTGAFDGTQITGPLTVTRTVYPNGGVPWGGTITYSVTLR